MTRSCRRTRAPRKTSARTRIEFEALETRVLHSADSPVGAALTAGAAAPVQWIAAPAEPGAEPMPVPAVAADGPTIAGDPAALSSEVGQRHEIVFVDARVPNADELLASLREQPGTQLEIVLLDAQRNGVAQITEVLAQRHDITAIHLISHGADGRVQLGDAVLEFDSLLGQATQIRGWADALTADADLLIYGCDVASAADGEAMLAALARLTGADVAASVDLTGSTMLGGDWTLEYRSGFVESSGLFDDRTDWLGLLAIAENGSTSSAQTFGATSLSWAHTVASGTDQVLMVEVAMDNAAAPVTGISYGGVALNMVGRTATNHAVEIWSLVAPTAGTANVVITFAGSTPAAAGATTYSGVDQADPTGTYAGLSGTGNTASVTAVSADQDLVIDVQYFGGGAFGYGVGADQTSTWSESGFGQLGTSSSQAGASSVVMSGSVGNFTQWEIGAVSLHAAAPPNAAPANTVPGAQVTNEDTPRVFSVANGNAIAIADSDAGGADNQITLSVTQGSLTLSGVAGLSFVTGDGTADATMTVRGTAAAINAALNGLVYSPSVNASGAVTLTLTTTDAQLLSLDIDSALRGRYRFDNAGLLVDSSPTGSPAGTASGGVASVDDPTRGDVLGLSAAGQVQIPGRFGDPPNLTLAAWVNLSSTGSSGAEVISLGDNALLRLDNGSPTHITGGYYNGTTWIGVTYNAILAGDGWHHVAYTFNDTADLATLYLDGVAVSTLATTDSIVWANGSDTIIGRHGNGGTTWDFTGSIDDARVYGRVLDAGEIAQLANDLPLVVTSTVSLTVNPVNDAPTITAAAIVSLSTTDEATASSATAVGTLLTSAAWADADAGSLRGIAITAASGLGTWQYSTDGLTWTAFGAVSGSSALLLADSTQVRYLPDGLNGETASFSFRAWDQSSGSASTNGSPAHANPGAGGGSAAYSSQTAQAAIVVSSLNDAPTLSAGTTVVLAATTEDATSSATLVDTLLTGAGWADSDSGAARGIAVTSVTGSGSWQYSTDGISWSGFGTVSAGNALLLSAASQVRYLPAGTNGETAIFGFRAWDQSNGTASTHGAASYANPGAGGGTSAWSAQSASASLTVTAVNDAPTLINGASVGLVGTNEDSVSAAASVASLLTGVSAADVDTGALGGIAITGIVGNGTWQYSTDGVTWTAFGAVAGSNALLLNSTSQIRYVPDGLDGETASFTYRAWDQTSGTASSNGNAQFANAGLNGGSTAYSVQSASASLVVSAVNDAPAITAPGAQAVGEDTTLVFSLGNGNSLAVADADAGVASVQLTLSVAHGSLSLSGTSGLSFTVGTGTGNATMTFSGSLADVNAALQGLQYRGSADFNGPDTLAVSLSDLGNTGAGGASSASANVAITVSAVNDAPLNQLPAPLTTGEGTAVVLSTPLGTRLSISDIDAGGALLQVTLGASHGRLSLSGTSGLSFTVGSGTGDVTMTMTGTLAALNAALDGLRFDPDAGYHGAASILVTTEDLGNSGSGGNASDTDVLAITVTPVNDAPMLTGGTVTLTGTDEDQPSSGTPLAALLAGAGWSDADAGAVAGVAITATSGRGSWQYSIDGNTWTGFGAVSASHALLLDAGSQVRYVPDGLAGETVGLTFRAWDQTSGVASGSGAPVYVVPGSGGGSSAYSAMTAAASLIVDALNDAPDVTIAAPVYQAIEGQGLQLSQTGLALADVDAANGLMSLLVSVGEGQLQAQAGSTGVLITGNGTGALTLTGTLAQLNQLLQGQQAASLWFIDGAPQPAPSTLLTLSLSDQGHSGSGGVRSDLASVQVSITPVDQAPLINAPASVTLTEDLATVFSVAHGSAISLSDVDPTGQPVTLNLQVTHGTLTLAGTVGLVIVAGADGSSQLSVRGTLAALNQALDGAVYAPTLNYNGSAALQVLVVDGAATAAATVTLQIEPVDDLEEQTAPVSAPAPVGSPNSNASSNFRGTELRNTDSGQRDSNDTRNDDDRRVIAQALPATPGSQAAKAPQSAAQRSLRPHAAVTPVAMAAEQDEAGRRDRDVADAMYRNELRTNGGGAAMAETLRRAGAGNATAYKPIYDTALGAPRIGSSPAEGQAADDGEATLNDFSTLATSLQAGSVLLSAGAVMWVLRSAGLATAMLSAVPAWRSLDPLVLLAPEGQDAPVARLTDNTQLDGDERSVAAIFDALT